MARPQHLALVLAAALAAGTGMTLSSTAHAYAACPSGPEMGSTTTGDVSPSNRSDWWRSTSYTTPRTFSLVPAGGDADLFVYSASNCSTPLCSSTNGSTTPDSCTVTAIGPVNVEVRYYSSPDGMPVSYTLSTTGQSAPVPPGVVPTPGYPSDDCARDGLGQSIDAASGFARDTYVTLRTQTVGDELWVCTRVDDGSTSYGGKLVVSSNTPVVGLPRVDNAGGSCSTQPGNQQLVNVLDQVILDLATVSDEMWVCLRAPLVSSRVVVPLSGGSIAPDVKFYEDAPGHHVYEHVVPVANSGSCQAATWGKTRYADVASGGSRAYLYTYQEGNRTDICIGQQNPTIAGGVLSVELGGGGVPTVRPAYNGECTQLVAAAGPVSLRIGRTANSASACITNGTTMTGITVVNSGGAPVAVTWTPDGDSIIE